LELKAGKIGFGGGCHWCTEAVFQALKGVSLVEQGWIASEGHNDHYSEAVVVHFIESEIDLKTLIHIHLLTHSCTSDHSMRQKYRSAIYTFTDHQVASAKVIIKNLQSEFDELIITQVIPFVSFEDNKEEYKNYYLKNAENQFCRRYIDPKLSFLMKRFSKHFAENWN